MKNQHEKHIKAIGHKLRWVKCKLLLIKKYNPPPLTSSSADEQVTNIQSKCQKNWSNVIVLWNNLKKGLERENVPVIHCSGWPIIIWLNRFTRPNIRLGMAWFRDQGLWLQICYGFPIISSSCSLSSEVFALIVTLHCFVPSSCIVFTVHQSFVSV